MKELHRKLAGWRWWPMAVWLLLVFSMSSWRGRSPGELVAGETFDLQNQLKFAGWVVLGLIAARTVMAGRSRLGLLRAPPLIGFAGLVVLGFLSAAYSPSPAYTLFMAAQFAIILVLCISASVDQDFFYRALAAFLFISLILALARGTAPPVFGVPSHVGRLGSPLGHPSILGTAGAVGAAGLWARWCRRGLAPVEYGALAICVLVTLATISRTAIAGMFLAMALGTLLAGRLRGFAVATWATMLVATIELATGTISGFLMRGQSAIELQSLSARTEVWQAVGERLRQPSLLGEGLGSTRYIPLLETVGLGHTHNIFLEALVTLGVLGAFLVCFILATWVLRQFLFQFHGHGRWKVGVVSIENICMLIPLLAFVVLDRGFLTVDPLVPIYVSAIVFTQVAHSAASARPVHGHLASGGGDRGSRPSPSTPPMDRSESERLRSVAPRGP